MVVTAHFLASEVGVEILKEGGNAFDAAVAVQFTLAVVYPRAGNIAGGGFALIRTANGEYNALDFREKAPKAATKNMYQDKEGNVIPGLSQLGYLAVGVPGSVDGMVRLHQKYGKLNWSALLEPAIKFAKEGVVLTRLEAAKLNNYKNQIELINGGYENNPYQKSEAFATGDTLKNPELAATLIRIQKQGRKGFYDGAIAKFIIDEMQQNNGLITAQDLKDYRAVWRTPLTGNYRDCKVIGMPPPSSGGIALIQLLKGAQEYPIQKLGFASARYIHLLVELERRVFADRAKYLGDGDFYPVPVKELISTSYLKKRFADIQMNRKTDSREVMDGAVDLIESFETTHFSIVDKDGNAIAITTTLNGNYGSKLVVQGGGFFLNNEMDDFSAKPGVPNQFGLIGGKANAIQPEKRMLSSMSPTILEKNNKLYMILGSPGGSTIITSVFQNIINAVDFKMNPQQIVNALRFHSQCLPDEVYVEPNLLSDSIRKQLEQMGHIIKEVPKIGMMANIMIESSGAYIGVADTLRHADSRAVGY
ncbi:gamma-glutamyltransferase [Ancylomarina longa]|uniref:Glutathione hydrolase proenzyme n=2 Tax=Ancylomarina longa TaxID=2487017 RepID=A0A434AZY9_9BACT|nr:gamma-glutamyltransferase [Ancylomarina longa]